MAIEQQNQNMIAEGDIPLEQPLEQPGGLSIDQLDHEFLGRGDPQVEGLRLGEQYEKNLAPEELTRMKQLAPAVEEFFILDYKGRTGKLPEGEREMPEGSLPPEDEITVEEYGDLYNVENKEEVLSEMFGQKQPVQPQGVDVPPRQVNREQPPVAAPQPAPQPVAENPEGPRIPAAVGMKVPSLEEAGESGMIQEPGKSNSGVADDIPMDVQEGDFIINAAAVTHAGIADANRMIEDAKEKYKQLVAQGTIQPVQGAQPEEVPIQISNGEVRVSKQLADIIGMDKLEKINNRGLAKTQEKLQEEEQLAQSNPAPEQLQSPKGRMT